MSASGAAPNLASSGAHNAFALREQRGQQMQRLNLLLICGRSNFLRGLQGLLGLHC